MTASTSSSGSCVSSQSAEGPVRPARRRLAWLVVVAIAAALLGCALLARMGPALSLALALALPGAEFGAGRRALAAQSPSIGLAGLSFGAGPALLAAADVPDLALTASFGGYADLREVILYLTTGIHQFGGRRYMQAPEEYNRWKLLALLVDFVQDPRDRRLLDRIAGLKLADPGADTGALEADLGREGHAVRALVLNRREDAVGALLAALPAEARA